MLRTPWNCLIAAAMAAAASIAHAGTTDAIFASGFEASGWVQGYYVGYERDLYPIEAVDFGALTHLMSTSPTRWPASLTRRRTRTPTTATAFDATNWTTAARSTTTTTPRNSRSSKPASA